MHGTNNDPLSLSLSSSLHDTRLNTNTDDESSDTVIAENDAASSTDDIAAGTSHDSVIDVKPNLVPIYEIHKANNEGIRKQLEDKVVEIIDDMEITVTSKGFGKPLNATAEGLIKRETRDEISGDIPFITTVGTFILNKITHNRYSYY